MPRKPVAAPLDGEHGGSSLSGLRNPVLVPCCFPACSGCGREAGPAADCTGSGGDYNDQSDYCER